jgi:glutathione synthase/RimK-type ligase-like ATP-grasp enzyme
MTAALLYGSPSNPHLAALAEELPGVGVEPRVLDPRRFPGRGTLSLRLGRAGAAQVETTLADLDGVGVGWFSSHDGPRLSGDVLPSARRFARAASMAALVSLRDAEGFPWVNDPWRGYPARDKFTQLLAARRRGLRVPETLVTNDPAALRAMARRLGSVAVKSPSGSAGLRDDMRILTQRVGPEELDDDGAIRSAPVMAQAYVPKRTEVRATVVAGRVMAVEIHSQETERTRVDWRRYDHRTRYERLDLPADVRRACVQVTRDVGLDYSGIDLVRTPRDEYVFLEVNSEPAWLWIEDLTGMRITRALAGLLKRKARGRAARGAREEGGA